MAPNIPLGDNYRDSEEASGELLFDLPPKIQAILPEGPKHFHPHHETIIPNVQPISFPRPSQPPTTAGSLRPVNPRTSSRGDNGRLLQEVSRIDLNRDTRRRGPSQDILSDFETSPSFIESTVLPRTSIPNIPSSQPSGLNPNDQDVPGDSSSILQVPATLIPGRVPPTGPRESRKDLPVIESRRTSTQIPSSSTPPTTKSQKPTTTTTKTTTTSSTTYSSLDSGVLRIPGHEPEAPADLVLIHHDRAIDTQNQTGLDGIIVRDDSTFLTPEGATALILVGLCSFFLVFICFIMFIEKIRRQRIDSKIVQDDDDIKKPRYDTTNYSTHHQPNPLSFLPPEILNALMNPTITSKAEEVYEEPKPAFLTMEPPGPGSQLGRLWFSVYYDYVKSTLVLHILHARYAKGRGSVTNPGTVWVEACVLTPMNTIKATSNTDTRRASLAPVFNQSFKFMVEDDEVTRDLLRLTLYDKHPLNGEKAVGSVIVPLSTVDLCSTETISRDLQ